MVALFQVDAFTSEPFSGNPAAVCLLEAPATDAWMQAVASEMNLSETAFVTPGEPLGLRWFTPTTEVPLCGHATLASAHVLWSEHQASEGATVRFSTLSGVLGASRAGEWIVLDLPAREAAPAALDPQVLEAIGAVPVRTASGTYDLIEVATEDEVAATAPHLAALGAVPRVVIVTAAAGGDVVCRVFAPGIGIDEDPATGSAGCVLGPWWAPRLGREFTVRQLSRRGGTLRVTVGDDGRVAVAGQAVTTVRGALVTA